METLYSLLTIGLVLILCLSCIALPFYLLRDNDDFNEKGVINYLKDILKKKE